MAYLLLAGKEGAHLLEIQTECFGELGTGTSAARNTMRRIVRCNLVARTDEPGVYNLTTRGRNMVTREVRQLIESEGSSRKPTKRAKNGKSKGRGERAA